MNIAEGHRLKVAEQRIADLEREVANLKEIIDLLTTKPDPFKKETLKLKHG